MTVRLIYLDTETTGFKDPVGVVECAYIELDLDTLEDVGRQHSLIDPQLPIQSSASGIHNITSDMVAESPTLDQWFNDVLGEPFKCTDLLILAAHNVAYDHPKVAAYLPENVKLLCTLKLAKRVFPDAEDHKLTTLKYQYDLGRGAAHSAMGDVETGVNLLRLIAQETGMGLEELLPYQDTPLIYKTMPFGKFKDRPVTEVDRGWLTWYLKKPPEEQDPDIMATFQHYFPRFF